MMDKGFSGGRLSVTLQKMVLWLMQRPVKWGMILLLSGLLLLPSFVVLAHNPVFVQDGNSSWQSALLIPDHQVSWAIYGRLATPGEVDFFVFEGVAGESATIKMDVPLIDGLEAFRPSMALVGPGLFNRGLEMLPVGLPTGNGAIVVPDNGRTDSFYERHSGTSYWERQERRVTLPATGRYTVLVWSPLNMVGKYLLVMGTREQRMAGPPGTRGSFQAFFAHPVGSDVPYPAGVPLDLPSPEPTQTQRCRFFTETGGFSVCDDMEADFLAAFERWGLEKIGYPISRRYVRDGFITQAFQKSIMQWRADNQMVTLVNVFDDLHELGLDDRLLETYQTPAQLASGWDGNVSFDMVIKQRQALLNARPALRRAYFASNNPLTFYGLPTSEVQDMGNHYAIRLQRAVLQEWKESVPWAEAGGVTIANGGDMAKRLGVLPADALLPE